MLAAVVVVYRLCVHPIAEAVAVVCWLHALLPAVAVV